MSVDPENVSHGRRVVGGQPVVFHCNHYNYWLQKTLLLDPSLGMAEVIEAAAAEVSAAALADVPAHERLAVASERFRNQGFGTLDFGSVDRSGGEVVTPTSHYGQLLSAAAGAPFALPQNLFDRGFIRGVLSSVYDAAYVVTSNACHSVGGDGRMSLGLGGETPAESVGVGRHYEGGVEAAPTPVDVPGILAALSQLDLSGNEEGFIPRFGVMLTNHYANFYNRISFEFLARMRGTGLLEEAEQLLVDAGYRCAFNTFGGIMTSAEWDAVVKPQCRTPDDWVYGMVAVINALGWGVWQVRELSEDRLVVRIYDDYESAGYHAMYGQADRPVCFLHMGGVSGLMHLARYGAIHEQPRLDAAYFERCFEVDRPFTPRVVSNFAGGDPYTEIVAERL